MEFGRQKVFDIQKDQFFDKGGDGKTWHSNFLLKSQNTREAGVLMCKEKGDFQARRSVEKLLSIFCPLFATGVDVFAKKKMRRSRTMFHPQIMRSPCSRILQDRMARGDIATRAK